MNELCTLNPELLDIINEVTNKAADLPPPALDKVCITLLFPHNEELVKLVVGVNRMDHLSKTL